METHSDFKELFRLFNAARVEYLIVGAYALAFHGVPRNTGDIDVLVKSDPENAARLLAALDTFGFGALGLSVSDFIAGERVVQLGVVPVRVDLMTSITGVSWEEARASCVAGDYGGVPVHFLGREQLIRNKRATGRIRDLADIEALEGKG